MRRSISRRRYLTVRQVLNLHAEVMRRDRQQPQAVRRELLESAVSAPRWHAQFRGNDIFALGVVLAERLAINHPFSDGNKRTALIALLTFLESNGVHIPWGGEDLARLIEGLVVDREGGQEALMQWLKQHAR